MLRKYSNQVDWKVGLFFGQLGWASKSHSSKGNLSEKVAQGNLVKYPWGICKSLSSKSNLLKEVTQGLCTKRILSIFMLCLQLWVQLVSKSTNFAIVIVVVLHVPKSQSLLVTNVTKSWHMPICSCKCDYYAFWMKNWMRDELMSTIFYHIQWQMKKIVFAKIVCTIELTCPFSVASTIIYNNKVVHTMRKLCMLPTCLFNCNLVLLNTFLL